MVMDCRLLFNSTKIPRETTWGQQASTPSLSELSAPCSHNFQLCDRHISECLYNLLMV